jgi:hypothetical protein
VVQCNHIGILTVKKNSEDGSLRKSGSVTRGVCQSPQRRAAKLAFLAESSRQGNELTKERQLRQAYTKFFKTEDGRAFARSFGRSIPINGPHRPTGAGEDSIDFCDPADLARASVLDDPIDHIEPPADSGSALDRVTREDVKSATAIFESSMRWCIDGVGLVHKGQRSAN